MTSPALATAASSSRLAPTDIQPTTCPFTALLLDLSEDLTGKQRDVALAIHQLSELEVLLMERESAVAGG
jgi:hypothetical protein